LEEFTPAQLKALREGGYKAVVLLHKSDQIILKPLKEREEEERLQFLNLRQVEIHDPELEVLAHRSGIPDHVKIFFSDGFKVS
jgi:hypothetical protein